LNHQAADDEVIAERVRAKMGRLVSHPHAIEVACAQGRVTLSGPVLACEVHRLVAGVESVRGVTGVESRLQAHNEPGDVPGLQGGVTRTGERSEFLRNNWSPAARLLVGLAGGALALYGVKRGGAAGTAVSVAGINLLTQGIVHNGP